MLVTIRWHCVGAEKVFISPHRHNKTGEKCTAGSDTVFSSWSHVTSIWISIRLHMFLTPISHCLVSLLQFPRQFLPPGLKCVHCRPLFFLSCMFTYTHTHTQSLSPPSAVKHWEPRSGAFSSEWRPCLRERERVFVISDPETERAVESLPGLMDISTWSHEGSRKRHRKCLRGCVMPSLITASVAPAFCMLMQWENTGGFCMFSPQTGC